MPAIAIAATHRRKRAKYLAGAVPVTLEGRYAKSNDRENGRMAQEKSAAFKPKLRNQKDFKEMLL